jgi:hypothetical protein
MVARAAAAALPADRGRDTVFVAGAGGEAGAVPAAARVTADRLRRYAGPLAIAHRFRNKSFVAFAAGQLADRAGRMAQAVASLIAGAGEPAGLTVIRAAVAGRGVRRPSFAEAVLAAALAGTAAAFAHPRRAAHAGGTAFGATALPARLRPTPGAAARTQNAAQTRGASVPDGHAGPFQAAAAARAGVARAAGLAVHSAAGPRLHRRIGRVDRPTDHPGIVARNRRILSQIDRWPVRSRIGGLDTALVLEDAPAAAALVPRQARTEPVLQADGVTTASGDRQHGDE